MTEKMPDAFDDYLKKETQEAQKEIAQTNLKPEEEGAGGPKWVSTEQERKNIEAEFSERTGGVPPQPEDLDVPKPKESAEPSGTGESMREESKSELSEEERKIIEAESAEAQMGSVRPHPEDVIFPTEKKDRKSSEQDEMSDEERQSKEKGYTVRDKRRFAQEAKKAEAGEAKQPEKPEGGKPEAAAESKKLLEEKLNAARDACATALYEKEKRGSELDKKEGFFNRIFAGHVKREKWRAENEDYLQREKNYRQSQEDFKSVLKEYRLASIEEKRKQLEKNREEFLKILPNGEKISEDILKNVKLEDVALIEGMRSEKKLQEKSQKYKDAVARKDIFVNHLKNQGVSEADAEKFYRQMAIGDLTTGKDATDRQIEKYAKQVAIETTLKEATEMYNLKEHKRIEDLGEQGKWIKEYALKGAEWYRHQKWYKKIGLGVGLAGAGMAAGAIGGATGAAILSGVLVGRVAQRILGGAATAIGTEVLLKKNQENAAKKEITKTIGDKYLEILKNNSSKLDEKLFEISGRKGGEEKRRYILAGTMGVLVGSGVVAGALRNALDWIPDSVKEPVFHKLSGVKEMIFGGGTKPTVGLPHETPEMPGVQKPAFPGKVIPGPYEDMPPGGQDAALVPESISAVGSHGPEGNIIDYLRNHQQIARGWGWDKSKMSLDKFAGMKAHQMWSDFAKAEIVKPNVQEQLEKLGYSKDLDGYAQMMHRIGKGAIEINPQGRGSMNLMDSHFLKAPAILVEAPVEAPIETPSVSAGEPTYADVSQTPKGSTVPFGQETPRGAGSGTEQIPGADQNMQPENLPPQEARAFALKQNYVTNGPGEAEGLSKPLAPPSGPSSLNPDQLNQAGVPDQEIPRLSDNARLAGRDVITINELADQPLKALEVQGIPVAEKINFVTDAIRRGALTSEDFGKYYASKLGLPPLSEELRANLNRTFEMVKGSNVAERLSAEKAVKAMLQRLEATK